MGLTIISDRLAPPAPGVAHAYAVTMHTEIRLPGQVLQQATEAVLRHTVVAELPAGHRTVELVTVGLRALAAQSPFADLLLDIARANSPLLLEVDAHGQLLRVRNKAALAAQWQELGPWLLAKHQHTPAGPALLGHVARQYRDDNERLEQALANKGACGALLPGVYGLRPVGGDARTTAKTLHQFFGGGALPVQVAWTATAAEALAPTADVRGTGRLDPARFDHAAFRQHLATMTGPTPRPPALQVAWAEHYTVSRAGHGLLAGEQTLRVGIPGVYEQTPRHTLRQTSPPL